MRLRDAPELGVGVDLIGDTGRPATVIPSSTNWISDWLEPLAILSLLSASACSGDTIHEVRSEPLDLAA